MSRRDRPVPVRLTLEVVCSNGRVAEDVLALFPSRDALSEKDGVESVSMKQEVGERGPV
jgi:hypothetical protein